MQQQIIPGQVPAVVSCNTISSDFLTNHLPLETFYILEIDKIVDILVIKFFENAI